MTTSADISIAGSIRILFDVAAARSATDTVSTRARWLISSSVRSVPRSAALSRLITAARVRPTVAWSVVRTRRPWRTRLVSPCGGRGNHCLERLLFLVDRSRSVGPAGLEAEREVSARRILEALPPTTRFDALFFDRGQKRLFPLARTATREAIAAFEDEMVPARLANGTELGAALRAAGDLLRREQSEFGPRGSCR